MMAAKRVTFTPTNVVLDFGVEARSVGGEDELVRRLAHAGDSAEPPLDPTSPLAPMLARGPSMADSNGAGVCRLTRADGPSHPSRRADPGRIGRGQSRDLPRRVAHSRARAAGPGGPAAGRGVEVGDVARGRSPRPGDARSDHRRRGGGLVVLDGDPTEQVGAYRDVVAVYLGGRKLDVRSTSPSTSPGPWHPG